MPYLKTSDRAVHIEFYFLGFIIEVNEVVVSRVSLIRLEKYSLRGIKRSYMSCNDARPFF